MHLENLLEKPLFSSFSSISITIRAKIWNVAKNEENWQLGKNEEIKMHDVLS